MADWRYLIPNGFSTAASATHPMLYVGGYGGVFRSFDNGTTWSYFPDGAVNADGTVNTNDLLNCPLGEGGGLPNVQVTDLDLSLGNIDHTTGRPDVSTGPNLLMASTYGRGAYAIRLAPDRLPQHPPRPTPQSQPQRPGPRSRVRQRLRRDSGSPTTTT